MRLISSLLLLANPKIRHWEIATLVWEFSTVFCFYLLHGPKASEMVEHVREPWKSWVWQLPRVSGHERALAFMGMHWRFRMEREELQAKASMLDSSLC